MAQELFSTVADSEAMVLVVPLFAGAGGVPDIGPMDADTTGHEDLCAGNLLGSSMVLEDRAASAPG